MKVSNETTKQEADDEMAELRREIEAMTKDLENQQQPKKKDNYYSTTIYVILLATILFGATSSLAVKTLFQTGLDDPFYVNEVLEPTSSETDEEDIIEEQPISDIFVIQEGEQSCNQSSRRPPLTRQGNITIDRRAHLARQDAMTSMEQHPIAHIVQRMALVKQQSYYGELDSLGSSPVSLAKEKSKLSLFSKSMEDSMELQPTSQRVTSIPPLTIQLPIKPRARDADSAGEKRVAYNDVPTIVTLPKTKKQQNETEKIVETVSLPMAVPAEKAPSDMQKSASARWLTADSERMAIFVRKIPPILRPVIPAILGLLSNFLGSISLLLVPTYLSVTFMSGGSMIASLFAAKYIRCRIVPTSRWQGAAVVGVGLIAVSMAPFLDENEKESGSIMIFAGIAALVGSILTKTLRSISHELFLHETDFPAFLLLGLEGVYGLFVTIPVYLLLGPVSGYVFSDTIRTLVSDPAMIALSLVLIPLFLLNQSFSIVAIDLTSASSRGIWKAPTGLVAWAGSLIIYYSTGQDELGSGWSTASAMAMFAGYAITFLGIKRYYQTSSPKK